jgi:hypothetical protein
MQHLVGSTQTLVLAALLLVVVASLPSLPSLVGRAARWRVPGVLIALVGSMFLLHIALRHGRVMPDLLPYRVVRNAEVELEKAVEPNVIVVDGASYVLNGVDPEVLEETLRELGYQNRVVRFAAGAANHFERFHMQQSALLRSRRAPDPKQRWVYMTEVQRGYDAEPLAQFGDNQDTSRTYHYMTPENAWSAYKALSAPGSDVPLRGAWRWPLLRHALINASSTGAFQRLVPDETMRLHTGRVVDPPRRARFKFRGMRKVIKAAHKRGPKAVVPVWLPRVREPRSRRLWQPRLDALVYFGLPTTSPEQMTYIRAFCRSTKAPCLAPTDKEMLKALDEKSEWRNATHLSRSGAITYTRWLARALAETGVLQK